MRIDYALLEPELTRRFRELTRDLAKLQIAPAWRALVELRVSQINGCAYCIAFHRAEARALKEDEERIADLPEWRDSARFTAAEKAGLGWAEALTHTGQLHHDEVEYAALRNFFSEAEIVALGLVVSTANFWNRMAGGFRKEPVHPLN